MTPSFDVIIIGLGAMGSAAAYHLAKAGKKVLGLDRFSPPHAFGSSHGKTRIIREAYFEDPLYVPLVQRAYELWRDLENQSDRRIIQQTGGLMIGRPNGMLVKGAQRSAREHRLAAETLSSLELRSRFPALSPFDEMVGVWEPRAGILFPESCIQSHLQQAAQHGATLRFDEEVISWKSSGRSFGVSTASTSSEAGQILFTSGSWLSELVPDLRLPLTIERQVLFWFEPIRRREDFLPDRCPIYIWEHDPGQFFYGFPDLGDGVKVAGHYDGQACDPNSIDRLVRESDIAGMRAIVERHLPNANGELRSAVVCMYTNTPDTHFLIDFHPKHPEVLLASPCSGHGFKFSSAIGEVLADLLITGESRFDLSLFRLDRFGSSR
ncbi:MAG: N-methyl-L-tryptophan oxidase [Verrucomicrobia bacterium]|nr:N-methyl-L-tryptophan oxidase [Verrucomicrobiota bacterium]